MEGWLNGIHQRFPNGTLDPAKVVPTLQALINASRMEPPKEILLKAVPGGGPAGANRWPPARLRSFAKAHADFPLAAVGRSRTARFSLLLTCHRKQRSADQSGWRAS